MQGLRGDLRGWESSPKPLCPEPLLSLAEATPQWACTPPATLKPGQGRARASVPRRGGTASTGKIRRMDGHKDADRQPGQGRDAEGRAASLPGGPQRLSRKTGPRGGQSGGHRVPRARHMSCLHPCPHTDVLKSLVFIALELACPLNRSGSRAPSWLSLQPYSTCFPPPFPARLLAELRLEPGSE